MLKITILLFHRHTAVDDAIRVAEIERAAKYTQVRKLDKRIKAAIDGRQEMIHQLVAEQKQINQNINELQELATAVNNNRSGMQAYSHCNAIILNDDYESVNAGMYFAVTYRVCLFVCIWSCKYYSN